MRKRLPGSNILFFSHIRQMRVRRSQKINQDIFSLLLRLTQCVNYVIFLKSSVTLMEMNRFNLVRTKFKCYPWNS